MAHLTIIAGLPGSGKSTLIDCIAAEYDGVVAHDVMDGAPSPEFTASLHYAKLIRDLRDGKRCLIADVVFCDPSKRNTAKRIVTGLVPGVVFDEKFFSNELDACLANIEERVRKYPRNKEFEIQVAQELTQIYVIPDGVFPIPVYRPEKA